MQFNMFIPLYYVDNEWCFLNVDLKPNGTKWIDWDTTDLSKDDDINKFKYFLENNAHNMVCVNMVDSNLNSNSNSTNKYHIYNTKNKNIIELDQKGVLSIDGTHTLDGLYKLNEKYEEYLYKLDELDELDDYQQLKIDKETQTNNLTTEFNIQTDVNTIPDNKNRIIEELKLFLSLKPSDKFIIESYGGALNYKSDKHTNPILIEDTNLLYLACNVGQNYFIITDEKIIHLDLNGYDRLPIFNKEKIMEIIKKNENNKGITYDDACNLAQKLIEDNDMETLPINMSLDNAQNNKLDKAKIGVCVVLFFKRDIQFCWLNFVCCDFRISKIINNTTKQPINIGYYKRDNEMNIINNIPYFDHHEEQTRYNDPNSLLLYASLLYKA